MRKHFYLFLLLAVSVLLYSCQKDDNVPQTDYSIESTSVFELISQHPNGWIKEAQYLRGIDQPSEEFEYYDNGYIKSAKIYASYPQQHLYMEVNRSEDNKPLWSKYYTPEGDLWFETEYENGFPSVKKVYSEQGTSVHSYTSGELTSVEFTAADNSSSSITSYNAAAGTRNLRITRNGESILDEDYAYQEQVGVGVYTGNHVPVANPFVAAETSYNKLNQSFYQSPSWQFDADPIEMMYPYRLYDEFYYPGSYFATRFTVSTDLYQSVIEQYPVTEKGVLMGGTKYIDGFDQIQNSWAVRDSLAGIYEQDPALYELKYGDEYAIKLGYGKIIFVIGAIRNLPTSQAAAEEIKQVAYRKMMGLLNGNNEITAGEQQLLNKVWFEVKFFSTLKQHLNGVVIDSAEDYEQAMQEVNDAELSAIQLEYQPVEWL